MVLRRVMARGSGIEPRTPPASACALEERDVTVSAERRPADLYRATFAPRAADMDKGTKHSEWPAEGQNEYPECGYCTKGYEDQPQVIRIHADRINGRRRADLVIACQPFGALRQ